jgi:hypothetical protein
MDKKIAGLLGAAAALTTVGGAHASTSPGAEPLSATTYRDLLEPVPNAVALLKADDAARAQQRPAQLQLAQWHHHHHHHHHHNNYSPGAAVLGGVIGGIIGAQQPRYYGPPPGNCYWTLGRPYWNGYAWARPRVWVCD